HEDVDNPAAGQPDGEGVVIADPVGLEGGHAALADLKPQFVHGTFDAATGHAADDLVISGAGNGHGRARSPGRAAIGTDHGGQAEGLAGLPPLRDPAQNVPHILTLTLNETTVVSHRWLTSAGMAAGSR